MPHFSLDQSIIEQLLPLGDSIITGVVTLGTAFITYVVGRSSRSSELKHLQEEKKELEQSNVSDSYEIVSRGAASTVQPLLDRIREQREEMKFLVERNLDYREEIKRLEDEIGTLKGKKEKE